MKYQIDYYNIEFGAHILASPIYTNSEYVEVDSEKKLHEYILKQKDLYGRKFKKSPDRFMGYDFISNSGGVKYKKYKEPKSPKFKKLK
ncbi:MAG: hypothetical protein ACOC1K_05570 [Nanoarchaeota archaeon]